MADNVFLFPTRREPTVRRRRRVHRLSQRLTSSPAVASSPQGCAAGNGCYLLVVRVWVRHLSISSCRINDLQRGSLVPHLYVSFPAGYAARSRVARANRVVQLVRTPTELRVGSVTYPSTTKLGRLQIGGGKSRTQASTFLPFVTLLDPEPKLLVAIGEIVYILNRCIHERL